MGPLLKSHHHILSPPTQFTLVHHLSKSVPEIGVENYVHLKKRFKPNVSVPPFLNEIVHHTIMYLMDVHTSNHLTLFFIDIQKKQTDNDCAPKASSSSSSSSSSQADIFCNETNGSISHSLMSMPNTSEDPSPGETGVPSLSAQDGKTAVNQ